MDRYYSRCQPAGRVVGGALDAAADSCPTWAEPCLASHYAPMRVVIDLDEGRCLRQAGADQTGRVQTKPTRLFVAPSQVILPRCWREGNMHRPSVAEAVAAQEGRAFEAWRWADAFELLIDDVRGTYGSIAATTSLFH